MQARHPVGGARQTPRALRPPEAQGPAARRTRPGAAERSSRGRGRGAGVARHFRRVPGWPNDVAESEEEPRRRRGRGGSGAGGGGAEEPAAGPGPRASIRAPWMRIGRGGGGGGVGGPAPGRRDRGG